MADTAPKQVPNMEFKAKLIGKKLQLLWTNSKDPEAKVWKICTHQMYFHSCEAHFYCLKTFQKAISLGEIAIIMEFMAEQCGTDDWGLFEHHFTGHLAVISVS